MNIQTMSVKQYILLQDEPAPIGFTNNGSLCWLNSLLQVLFGATAFKYAIEDTECDLANSVLSNTLMKLIRAPTADASARVIAAMGSRNKLNNGQQCSWEGFDAIVNMLGHKDIIGRVANAYKLRITCPTCANANIRYELKDDYGNITLSAPGVASEVRDEMRHIMIDTIAVMDDDKFQTYIRTHKSMMPEYTCPRGHKTEYLDRWEILSMLNEVVVMVFDKFHRKDNRYYPAEFAQKGIGGAILRWKLIGSIEHSGTMSGGHYVANTLRGAQWYYCNDGTVTPREYPHPTENTFMLIYHMIP